MIAGGDTRQNRELSRGIAALVLAAISLFFFSGVAEASDQVAVWWTVENGCAVLHGEGQGSMIYGVTGGPLNAGYPICPDATWSMYGDYHDWNDEWSGDYADPSGLANSFVLGDTGTGLNSAYAIPIPASGYGREGYSFYAWFDANQNATYEVIPDGTYGGRAEFALLTVPAASVVPSISAGPASISGTVTVDNDSWLKAWPATQTVSVDGTVPVSWPATATIITTPTPIFSLESSATTISLDSTLPVDVVGIGPFDQSDVSAAASMIFALMGYGFMHWLKPRPPWRVFK